MPKRNWLLASIPAKVLKENGRHLEPTELPVGQTLHEPGVRIDHVYFPIRGVVSMVNELSTGEVVEFATIGPEGMAGFPVLLRVSSAPSRALVQVPGAGFRMSAPAFRKMLDTSPETQNVMLRYMMALVTQIAQITACNRLHEIQQRCARWLLQTHDRVESDTFYLKQEFLAQMLGAHRPSVSVAAGMLQKEGLIEYSRGQITVLDRKGLERAACTCYKNIGLEYDRLLKRRG